MVRLVPPVLFKIGSTGFTQNYFTISKLVPQTLFKIDPQVLLKISFRNVTQNSSTSVTQNGAKKMLVNFIKIIVYLNSLAFSLQTSLIIFKCFLK